jgi:hypothetical protein
MRLLLAIGTAVLSLTIIAPVYAQQDEHDQKEEEKAKPADEKEKKAQPAKPAKEEEKNAKQEQHAPEATPGKQEQHAGGGRIPADRYKANFGRQHTFRVSQGDFRSGRFQYGGYWFGFGGAWPSNWLYTQDVYVIEIDGMYYLCNPMYPGVNLVINVTL